MDGGTNANNLSIKLITKNINTASYVCSGWTTIEPLTYVSDVDGFVIINGAITTSTDYAYCLWQVVVSGQGGQLTYADGRGTVTFSTAAPISKGNSIICGPLYTGTMSFSGGTDARYHHMKYTLISGGTTA